MYTGSSISIAAIIEHLLNMARDLEDLAHLSWRLAKESSSVEELEKAYRQEVTRGKEDRGDEAEAIRVHGLGQDRGC